MLCVCQAKQHSKPLKECVNQYKALLRKVQTRTGITKPKAPFAFDEFIEYMDNKKRELVVQYLSFLQIVAN